MSNITEQKKNLELSQDLRSPRNIIDKENQRPQEEPVNQLLRDHAIDDNREKNIQNYHFYLKIINGLLILFNVMFTEYLCMFRYACTTDDIEMNALFARTIPAFFFLSFFLQIITFKSANEVKKYWVKRIKFLDFFYFIFLLIFAIASFASSSQISSSSKDSTWTSLSPLVKSYYDNSIDVLVSQTTNNLILTGVFHLIVSVLFLCNAALLWNFDYTIPLNWRPRPRIHLSLEKESVLYESEKQKVLRRKLEKQQQSRDALFHSGPADKPKSFGSRFSNPMMSGTGGLNYNPLEKIQELPQDS